MKDSKLERLRHNAVLFGQQFLQGDDSALDRAFGRSLSATLSAHLPPHRERIYAPLDTLRLFINQMLSTDGACQDVVGRRLLKIGSDSIIIALSLMYYLLLSF